MNSQLEFIEAVATQQIALQSPSVRITGSDKLQSLQTLSNRSSIDSAVHHDLLDHAQCLSGVGLIEEQNCVNVLSLVLTSHFFRLVNFQLNIFVCCTAMNLENNHNS